MIVQWFVSRGFGSDGGLICTTCNCCFTVDFKYFYTNITDFIKGKKPDLPIFCPRCGCSFPFPDDSIESASSNYYKYKNIIEG